MTVFGHLFLAALALVFEFSSGDTVSTASLAWIPPSAEAVRWKSDAVFPDTASFEPRDASDASVPSVTIDRGRHDSTLFLATYRYGDGASVDLGAVSLGGIVEYLSPMGPEDSRQIPAEPIVLVPGGDSVVDQSPETESSVGAMVADAAATGMEDVDPERMTMEPVGESIFVFRDGAAWIVTTSQGVLVFTPYE